MEYSFVTPFEDLVTWFADGRKSRRKARWKKKLMRDLLRSTVSIYGDETEIMKEKEWIKTEMKRK